MTMSTLRTLRAQMVMKQAQMVTKTMGTMRTTTTTMTTTTTTMSGDGSPCLAGAMQTATAMTAQQSRMSQEK